MKSLRLLSWAGLLALAMTLVGTAVAYGQATVTTDRTNYSPGDTVLVTGEGWSAGETVSLAIHRNGEPAPSLVLTAVAEESGRIANGDFVVSVADTATNFVIQATGQQSGQSAQAAFMDGWYMTSVSVGSQSPPEPRHLYSSASYAITVQAYYWMWMGQCSPWCTSASLSVQGLPSGVSGSFSPQTVSMPSGSNPCGQGFSTLTLSVGNVASGTYTFTVVAIGCGEQVVATGSLVVAANRPPVVSAPSEVTYYEGDSISLWFYASDPDYGQSLSYWTSPLPSWLHLSSHNITGTPGETEGPGDYTVTVGACDNGLPSMCDSRVVTIHVLERNQPPQIASIGSKFVYEGQALSFQVYASDPDRPMNTLSYSLGAGSPSGATINSGSGWFYWVPGEVQGPGDYSIPVVVRDNGVPPYEASTTFLVHVGEVNAPPTLLQVADQVIDEQTQLTLAMSATDPDLPANVLTYSLPQAPAGATIDPASGLFRWTPGESDGPGNFTVRVRVTDNGGPTMWSERTFYIHVNEVNNAPVLPVIARQVIDECVQHVMSLEAKDPERDPVTYSLDPGAPEGVALDPDTGLLTWTPTEAQGPMLANVTVRARDNGNPPLEDVRTYTLDVAEVNLPPTIIVPPTQSVAEGDMLHFTAIATDPDLPANSLRFELGGTAPLDAVINPATGEVSWQTRNDATYIFSVTVYDGAGGSAVGDVEVSVHNVAPTVTIAGPASGSLYKAGAPVTFTGTFSDPGVGDTHTAVWTLDGLSIPATVDEAAGAANVTYTFTTAGVYLVRLRVTDDDGDSGEASQVGGLDAMVVVYDPNAGFVTGGGWIDSPPGACAMDPTLVGKANFGFVSKYKKGATAPTGETEFQFRAGNLNFHGATYQWLVIAGSKAQYKGSGTINGVGDYGFMLTATDGTIVGGGADRFRIKIQDNLTGDVVYDNQMGAGDTATPSTVLGGGNIVIQSGGSTGGWSVALLGAGGITTEASSPESFEFALGQNFPNPFAGATSIPFSLAARGWVRLAVFDAAGREVQRLVDEERGAGPQQVVWTGRGGDGARVAPGVYFCRLTVTPLDGAAGAAVSAGSAQTPFTAQRKVAILR